MDQTKTIFGKECALGEIDELMEGCEDTIDIDEIELEKEEKSHLIILYGWHVRIPSLGISLYEGTFANWDEDEEDYMADFSLTAIKDENAGEFVYWEQDPMNVSLHNWLVSEGRRMEAGDLNALRCVIERDEIAA